MTGRVDISDLRVLGVHGVLPFEREQPQPLSVDLSATFDVSRAARSDTLGDTVDYGALALLVANTVAETSFSLLEALGAEIARRVLDAERRVERVEVTVRKIRPPVAVDVGAIAVHVVDVRRP